MRVVNLWAGPGAGKSTTAAGLFYLFKSEGIRCELVTEYAKDLVYERRDMTDQLAILAQQNKRLRRLQGHVDWVITDSPIPLGLIYVEPGSSWDQPWFREAVEAVYHQYDNVNVILGRVKAYQRYGRNQQEHEARALDEKIAALARRLTRTGLIHTPANAQAPQELLETLKIFVKVGPVLDELSLDLSTATTT